MLRVDEVAAQLRVSRAHIYSLAREGLIPTVRVGRHVRVPVDALAAFIEGGGKGWPGGWRRRAPESAA